MSPVVGRSNLYADVWPHHVHAEGVVAFLEELRRVLGPFTVVWDRNNLHSKAKVVKAWLLD